MEFTVASRRWIRGLMTVWAAMLAIGVIPQLTDGSSRITEGAPMVVRVIAPIAMLFVVWSWGAYAVSLYIVFHVRERELRVERLYPRLARSYSWAEVRDWRLSKPNRGMKDMRIEFKDGTRVRFYPSAYRNADRLVARLETTVSRTTQGA
jgi:hypothetical protein